MVRGCPLKPVRKFRWFNECDAAGSIEWRGAAPILATLFLNFAFWYYPNSNLAMFRPIPIYAGALAAIAILITSLFFLGPALAGQKAARPLMGLLADSLGSIPAFGVRVACVLFLLLWVAKMVALPVWWTNLILRRDLSAIESSLVAAGILIFLFSTGARGAGTSARLALFSNRLAIAILVAAFLRVHEGWPAILKGFPFGSDRSEALDLAHGVSSLGFYIAPMMFVAADFGYYVRGKRDAVMTWLMGLALPLFGTLLALGLIGVATWASPSYQPSLQPNIGMALWSHAPRRDMTVGLMIAALSLFGALRFGVSSLAKFAMLGAFERRLGLGTTCLSY